LNWALNKFINTLKNMILQIQIIKLLYLARTVFPVSKLFNCSWRWRRQKRSKYL